MARLLPKVLIFAVALFMATSTAQAVVILGNLNGNDGTQTAAINDMRVKAMGFTMGSDSYAFFSATLRLETFGANVMPDVAIWSDAAGTPGASLYDLTNPAFAASGIANYVFSAPVAATLSANTNYWLVVSGTANGDQFDWKANNPGITPTGVGAVHLDKFFDTNGLPPTGPSSIFDSYALEGRAVPEPATAVLLLGALGGFVVLRRFI